MRGPGDRSTTSGALNFFQSLLYSFGRLGRKNIQRLPCCERAAPCQISWRQSTRARPALGQHPLAIVQLVASFSVCGSLPAHLCAPQTMPRQAADATCLRLASKPIQAAQKWRRIPTERRMLFNNAVGAPDNPSELQGSTPNRSMSRASHAPDVTLARLSMFRNSEYSDSIVAFSRHCRFLTPLSLSRAIADEVSWWIN